MKNLIQSGKTLLNAIAFANAGNLSEFETLMNTMTVQPRPIGESTQTKLRDATEHRPSMTPAMHHFQSAL